MDLRASGKKIFFSLTLALAYMGVSWVNCFFFKSGGILPMPIWPAAGLAIAASYKIGAWAIPGIWLGTLLANTILLGASLKLAAIIGVMNALAPLLAVYGIQFITREQKPFGTIRNFLIFILLAVIVQPILTATGGTVSQLLLGVIQAEKLSSAWLGWWFAHATGTILFAPMFLLLLFPDDNKQQYNRIEFLALFCATTAAAATLFFTLTPFHYGLPYFLIVPMAYVAVRYSMLHTMLLFTAVILMGIGGIVFNPLHRQGDLSELIPFRIMAVAYSIVLMLLAIMKTAHLRTEEERSNSEKQYRRLAENSPAVVYQLKMAPDGSFSFPFINKAILAITGITAQEVQNDAYALLKRIHPKDQELYKEKVLESATQLKPFHHIFRHIKDSSTVWIEAHSTPDLMPDGSILWDGLLLDITERKHAENALKTKTIELENYFLSAMDLLCIADNQGNFIRVNKEWERALGYSVEELQNRKFLDFVHPEDIQATTGEMARLGNKQKVINFTNRYRCKDNSYRFIEWRSTPNGDLIYAAARDVTERIQAEERLRESEKRAIAQRSAIAKIMTDETFATADLYNFGERITELLATTLNVARASIWKLTADDSKLICQTLYESDKKAHTMGYVINTDQITVYFNALRSESRVYAHDALNDPRANELKDSYLQPLGITSMLDAGILVEGRLFGTVSCEHIGPQRTWHPDEESFISTIGALIAQTIVSIDRRQAENALFESEKKLSALFSSMTEMVALHELVFNEQGDPVNYRITDCNKAFTKVTGISRESAVGKLATEVYRTKEPPYFSEYSRVALTMEPLHFETYYPAMEKHFSISIVAPEKNRFATITADVSAIKQAQQVISSKNRELEQLVYIASHDLRSPLVNVDGYGRELEFAIAELRKIMETGGDLRDSSNAHTATTLADMTDALYHIRNSTRQMDALLKGMLKLSRLGRSALNIVPLDMNSLVAEIVSTIGFAARKSEIELVIEALPPCRGDALQVTQVFTNLIGNAVKYIDSTRPGRIVVSGREEAGRSVYCVEDNGIGIARQHQENIFQIFHRLNPGATEGDGLGLTIVKQALNMLDGEIFVESEPGKGSRFFVKLPLVRSQE